MTRSRDNATNVAGDISGVLALPLAQGFQAVEQTEP